MYYEIAYGSLSNRNIIIDVKDLPKWITKTRKNHTELYHSGYKYDESIKEHFKVNKTIRGFRGTIKLDYIIFDIDKRKDTDDFVLQRCRVFVERLLSDWNLYTENILVWYSGTGYHVYIHNYFGDTFNDRGTIKYTITKYFTEVDPALYGATSIIRAPYSINMKSGLYKVPIPYDFLMDRKNKAIDIMNLAKTNEIRKIDKIEKKEDLDWSKYIETGKSAYKPDNREVSGVDDYSSNVLICMQTLYLKGQSDNNRHNELLRLNSGWRRQGITYKMALESSLNYNKTLEKSEVEKLVLYEYKNKYKYGCNDPIMRKYCSEKCIYYKKKNFESNIIGNEDLDTVMKEYVKKRNNDKYRINLKYVLGLKEDYNIYSGELVFVIGDTGMGKSAFVQNIVTRTPHLKWCIFPLENTYEADTRRYMQIANRMTKEQIVDYYTHGKADLAETISFINFVKGSVHSDDLRNIIAKSDCDVFVIDVLDQLGHKLSDYTAKVDALTLLVRDITNDLGKTLICVHHIRKGNNQNKEGRTDRQISIEDSKGASSTIQKPDKVISIEGDRNGIIRTIRSLKARDEAPFSTQMIFNVNMFTFEKSLNQ